MMERVVQGDDGDGGAGDDGSQNSRVPIGQKQVS